MSEKKICTLPNVRCNEAMAVRVRKAVEASSITVTEFMYQALVEKLGRMESDWRALNSIFAPDPPGGHERRAQPCVARDYARFEEDV